MNLHGTSSIVTGAGKGIGRAVTLAFLREGIDTLGCSRTKSDLELLATEAQDLPGKFIPFPADVSKEEDVRAIADKALSAFGKVDHLINNAGIGIMKPAYELTVEDWDTTMNSNLRSTFLCTRCVLPDMIKRESGNIVNIASIAGKGGFAGGAAYAASKFAMRGFAQSLMFDVRKYNIRVITVCPGSVATDFHVGRGKTKAKNKVLTAEDCAQVMLSALSLPANASMHEIELRITNP